MLYINTFSYLDHPETAIRVPNNMPFLSKTTAYKSFSINTLKKMDTSMTTWQNTSTGEANYFAIEGDGRGAVGVRQ